MTQQMYVLLIVTKKFTVQQNMFQEFQNRKNVIRRMILSRQIDREEDARRQRATIARIRL